MKYSWKVDDFDWEVFGFKVAKITEIDSSVTSKMLSNRIESLKKDLIKNKVVYAIHRVSSNNSQMIHALERAGFILVDGLISLSIDISQVDPESFSQIREASKRDLPELKKLTSGLFAFSRIDNDPLISKNKANEFYLKWIENSVNGEAADSVLVWEEKDKILGYITLQKKGHIPLLGVSENARGKGIAKKLLSAALAKFKKWGLKEVAVDTQMGNIPALRAYQGSGFKIVGSYLTFRWAS